jgi:MoaA/NifB/PqqE/SkfB family radical SAM enzyme
MPNIIITNHCNLQCPYCFADNMMQNTINTKQYIDAASFNKILDFCAGGEQEQIGIIGGEPTLHPQFLDIISTLQKYCQLYDCPGLIFTNGILLRPWLPFLGPNVSALVNCNSPQYQTKENYQATLDSLKQAHRLGYIQNDKVRIGCNLHLQLNDYSYIWTDIVEPFGVKYIRCSVASPGGCYADQWRHQSEKQKYYATLKPLFMNFIRDAKKHNCVLEFDCNQIPHCFFTEAEKAEIMEVALYPPSTFCRPSIDINPDLTVSSCFGTYDVTKNVSLLDFYNIQEVRQYLMLAKNFPKVQQNIGGKCATCSFHQKFQCQGGCLSFVEGDSLNDILH